MATHDYIISNASGAAVRADLNNALAAIATNNSSATEPTTTYAYQWWADTGSSPTVMKLRNAANSGWVTLFQLDGEWTVVPFENGTAAAPSIYFKDSGTDTGIYSPGTDQVGISAGGTSRFEVSTSATTSTLPVVHPLGAVGTPSITFTGDLNTGIWSPAADTVAVSTNGTRAITIDSSQRLGIGTTSPTSNLDVQAGVASAGMGIQVTNTDATGFTNLVLRNTGASGKNYQFVVGGNSSLSPNNCYLYDANAGAVRWMVDGSGRFLVGTSSARSNIREGTDNETPKIQLESATNDYSEAGLSIINNSSSGFAPQLWLGRSASDSIGGNALVSSGRIGSISFNAADGTNFIQGARIQADIDGTSGSGDLPTRLSFSVTSDGASSPTERVRITSDGTIRSSNVNGSNIVCINNGVTNTALIYFQTSSAELGKIRITGAGVAYDTTSDYRLKENIEPITDAVSRLQALKPWRFNFISHPDVTVDGFLAHEAQEVVPEAVGGHKDEEDAEGNPIYQGIDQSKLVPLLTAALQEAIGEIESLKARLTAAGI